MKETRILLNIVFWTMVVAALTAVVVFETGLLPMGYYAGTSSEAEFVLEVMMELATLPLLIPLALKLFSLKRVKADLVSRKSAALRKWGLLRLLMLLVPMVVNTLLYYMYVNTTFGYMAIIGLITLPFVYPGKSRCAAEVEES